MVLDPNENGYHGIGVSIDPEENFQKNEPVGLFYINLLVQNKEMLYLL
jgi:hypothetical protein